MMAFPASTNEPPIRLALSISGDTSSERGFTLLEFTKLILFSSIFVPGSPCPVVSQSKETPVSRWQESASHAEKYLLSCLP
jgi:hypothetical protein